MLKSLYQFTTRPSLLKYYWIGLAIIFLLGGAIRFGLPTPPIMDADTSSYLIPVIGALTEGVYIPTFRGFLYPYFLIHILSISPHFYSILFIQHILGLITAGLIVLIIYRFQVFFPHRWWLNWSVRLTAMLAALAFLFSETTIIMEHSIRPEALFPATCAVTLLAGIEFSRRLFLEKKIDRITTIWAIILIFFSIGNFYLKPAWGFTIATSLVPLFLAWLWISGKWIWKAGIFLVGIILACVAFIIPESFSKEKLGARKYWFLPGTLLAAHADMIHDSLQKEALSLPTDSKERAYLLTLVERINTNIQKPGRVRYGLRVNPDGLLYGSGIDDLWKAFQNPADFAKFCYYYYYRGWIKHPFAMLKKIAWQMNFFYSPLERNVYDPTLYLTLKELYQRALVKYLPDWDRGAAWWETPPSAWPPLDNYRESLRTMKAHEEIPSISRVISVLLRIPIELFVSFLNYTFLPLLIISAISAIIVLLGNRLVELKSAAVLVLYLSSFNFATSLTISVIHMMDVTRYYFGQITMSLVSQAFNVLFLLMIFAIVRRNWEQERRLPQEIAILPLLLLVTYYAPTRG